ncbi:glycosyltransferase [Amycolatopsis jiangsuensis]|uniref:Uncharacterized protein n=1 Tax=Amycolatopsis jiangsuensis TaxID=1181879 RepID=A0A840J1T2_9PSEU|nr:glycosyltransferase [Amycolatopsis jiangsuensis]MBB4687605.1 hypothetical protein [Amycolatopsis jiangsuensis]
MVHETGILGDVGNRNAGNQNSVGVVATVAATTSDDLNAIAQKYESGFTGDSGKGRFGLVIGINGNPGSEQAISQQIQQFQNSWDNRFPVAVVGFTWKNPTTDVVDQKSIPYGGIRETIVRNPVTENLTNKIRQNGGDNQVYLHIGDADLHSLDTNNGPLFDAVNDTVRNNPEGAPELISGGYRVRPDDGDLANQAAQLDLDVRQALAGVDSRSVYFPEPNTFVRMDGGKLENDATFGTKNPNTGKFDYGAKEGQGLVDSVLSQRNPGWQYSGHPDAIAKFTSDLAIRTDGSRIASKVGTDPNGITALTQSHANETTWSDQIGHYLANHTDLDPNLAKIAAKAAFHGITPNGPTPNRPGRFGEVSANLSPADVNTLKREMKDHRGDVEKLAALTLSTRQALIDNLQGNHSAATQTPSAAPRNQPNPPSNPQPDNSRNLPGPQDWHGRRDTAPATRFASERFDPATRIAEQFSGNREGLQGGQLAGAITNIRFDVRRFETSPGHWVREYTIPIDLTSHTGSVSPDERAQLVQDAQNHLDDWINQNYQLRGGDQVHIRIDARVADDIRPGDTSWETDSSRPVPVNVHDSTVDSGTPDTNQLNWDVHDSSFGIAHELMHFLGLGEGYRSDDMLFNRDDQPGVMGPDAWHDSRLNQGNLDQLENVSDTANIRDHHLGSEPAQNPASQRENPDDSTPQDDHTPEANPGLHFPSHAPDPNEGTPPVNGGKAEFKQAQQEYNFKVVRETGIIGNVGTRDDDNQDGVGVVATVPATTKDDLQTIAEKYAGGFTGNSSDGRFALVIGLNGTPGSERAISQQIQQFQSNWDNRFPVAVVGFTWKNPTTDVVDQKTIPYATIRETIARNPVTADLIGQIRESGGDQDVYLHTGDADVHSLNTPSGPLFDAVNSVVTGSEDGAPELISGGYQVRPDDGANASRAAQLDLNVRRAMAEVDPRSVYFPEPNTFVRMKRDQLENDVTFGYRKPGSSRFRYNAEEGQGLVDSVLAQRKAEWTGLDPRGVAKFDPNVAIQTDGTRIAAKVGTDPNGITALDQSHAKDTKWADQIGRYLSNHTQLTADQVNLVQLAKKAAFSGIEPGKPMPPRPEKFSDVLANLSPGDRSSLVAGMRQNMEDGKRLADLIVATRQALTDTLGNNPAPSLHTPAAAPPKPDSDHPTDSETGIDFDSHRGLEAVRESNPKASALTLKAVRQREFTADERAGAEDALKHYAPIIGAQRQSSSRADIEQEVQHIGAVSLGIENGRMSPAMAGEYIGSHKTVNIYALAGLDRDFGGGRREVEGMVTHELSHGLLKYALDDYTKHVGVWNEDNTPKRRPDAEPPSDPNARSDFADFTAAIKSHLLVPQNLAENSPRRAEFVTRLESAHPDVFAKQGDELSRNRAARIAKTLRGEHLGAFNEHTGYWTSDGFPAFDGERPMSRYGSTNPNEDMAETAKFYFLDPDRLRAEAPQRAAFFDQLVADWKPQQDDTVLVADEETSTEEEPDTRPLTQRLPEFARNGKALGSIVPADVRGAKDVGNAIENVLRGFSAPQQNPPKAEGIDAITESLSGPEFESFLGSGRKSMVRVGEKWYEVHVTAEPDFASVGSDRITKLPQPTIGDVKNEAKTTHASPHTDTTANVIGTSYFGMFPAGPYASLGGSAQLASPSAEHTGTTTGTEQRVIRSAGDTQRADVPVTYRITVRNETGGLSGSTVDGRVGLVLSTDLSNLKQEPTAGPGDPKPDWAGQIEFLAPEVVDLDENALFDQVSKNLHPSVTKFGAPGRTTLREFLSRGGVRSVLGTAMQGGPVVSNDLLSPHGSHRDAVQLQARPTNVELLGVIPGEGELRFNDSSLSGGSTTVSSKYGGDVNATFGGGSSMPGAVSGVAGVTGNFSRKINQQSTSGTSFTNKSTVNAKGDIGLYKVTVDLDVTTSTGEKTTVQATSYTRMGLPEAKAQGLPVPKDTAPKFKDVGTRYEPPYLAAAAAAGNVRAGSFAPATQVQPQIESALRDLPGFEKFLPRWDKFQSDQQDSGRDVAERFANLRKIASTFSVASLRGRMDSLLTQGVSTQLKRRGLFTDEYINVTVKAKTGPGRHLGQSDGRSVKNSNEVSPSLTSATTTERGWSLGVEGRVVIPAASAVAKVGISPTVSPLQYSDNRTWKNSGGPTVTTTTVNGGSPDSQVFEHDVEFEVEITSYTRNRPWVRRLTPGSPFRVTPKVSTVAETGHPALPKISGKVDLWVNDGTALKKDPGEFTSGKPGVVAMSPKDTPSIDDVLTQQQSQPSPNFLHVDAFANTEALRDEGLRQLQRAAGGDAVLGLSGSEARARVDRLFSPENLRGLVPKLLKQGGTAGGFRYERRMADRVGGLGMGMSLSNPKLVSVSETGGGERTYSGGSKASYEASRKQALEANAQLALTVRPSAGDAHGQGQTAGTAKWSPWQRTSGSSNEMTASVDHTTRAPAGSRTVLVQYDANVRLVAESRQEGLVNGPISRAGADVQLPGSVFVSMTEDDARTEGLLPPVEPRNPAPGTLSTPAMVGGKSHSLGAAVLEDAPNLSGLVQEARQQLGKLGGKLLPKSVLDDSMNNLQRTLETASPEAVTSLVDSALDGGVSLVAQDQGVLWTDNYQLLLKAKIVDTQFVDVQNDGSEVDHVVNSSRTDKKNSGHGSSYTGQVRGAGRGLFQDSQPKLNGYDGAYLGASGTRAKSDQTVENKTTTTAVTASSSGPSARYRHQIQFELVVARDGHTYPVASQEATVTSRSSADDQKISGDERYHTKLYGSRTTELGADQSSEDALRSWQQAGFGPLPDSSMVEGVRGAADVRAAALRALRLAGAGSGLTGPGTGSHNTLSSSITNETLQANLPDMVDKPFVLPELHSSAVTGSGHGSVKVYARVVKPDLTGLSDSVKLERSRQSGSTFTGEAKTTLSGEQQGNLGAGGITDPDRNMHSWGGLDVRNPVARVDPTSSTNPAQRSVVGKDKGRTGLVGFDVEYRVVATVGGKTAAVEVRVPQSSRTRMNGSDLEQALGEPLPESLTSAQDAVKKAAEDWRSAEEELEKAQQDFDDAWLAENDNVHDATGGARGLNVAVDDNDPVRHLRQALDAAQNEAREAGQALRAGNAEINRLNDLDEQLLSLALSEEPGSVAQNDLVADAWHAQQQAQQVRDGQPDLVRQRQAAQDRAAEILNVLDEYRNKHSDHSARQDDANDRIRAAREKADEALRTWWQAKSEVDTQIGAHTWPQPSTDTPRDGVVTEEHREGTVEASDAANVSTVSGWDTDTGSPYDFGVSEIQTHTVTDRSGKVRAVSFLPASEQTGDIERDWVTDNSGQISTLPEGATPQKFDPLLRQARATGATPELSGRRFGEWADESAAPWDEDSFFVFAHGRPESVKLTLLGGRTVRVSGDAFARIVANSALFAQTHSSVTLIACSAGQTDGPGGLAHDFQRTLSELGGPATVHAPTKPALFGRDSSALGKAIGATQSFTTVTEGGHFRTFGGNPGDEAIVGLVREMEHGELAPEPAAGPIPLSDRYGTLALASTVESQLADEVSRTGVLRLTEVRDLVSRHERPDVIWSAALTRLAARPDVAVHTVVEAGRDPEIGKWTRAELPPMARGLYTVTGKGTWTGTELSRPVRLNPAWSTGPARAGAFPGRPDARYYAETLVEHHLDRSPLPPVAIPAELAEQFKADVATHLGALPGEVRPELDHLVSSESLSAGSTVEAGPDYVLAEENTYSSASDLVSDLRETEVNGPAPAPLLGPDLFGLYRAPEPPDFLRGHDLSRLTAGQSLSFLDLLDLTKGYQLSREHLDPAHLHDNREWTLEKERADDKLAEWAPGTVEPLAKTTATPLLMHAIWLGGPLRNTGTMQTFRRNFGDAADRLGEGIVAVLWTDVPRWQTELALTTAAPEDGPDPLHEVRDLVYWAAEHNIQLVDVAEVFTGEHPMLTQEFYLSEVAKQTGPGFAAASDILRLELMYRFGGLYTDGDNVVHGLGDVVRAAESDAGYAVHRVGGNIANSAFTMSKGHPFAKAYLDQLRENYGQTQANLLPREVDALGQGFFSTPLGRVHRQSVMYRSGPVALTETARRIGLSSAQELPGMAEIRMNSDHSWLLPPQGDPPPLSDRFETLELTQHVVQTLVRGLYNRDGDLHLTAVEPAVRRHADPDLVWQAALSYLASDPELAALVRTVTDRSSYTGEVHDVPLPPAARALLNIDDSRVHHHLGEVQRAATLRPVDSVLVADSPDPLENGTARLTESLRAADARGGALPPIEVTGTGPDGRARAATTARELAGHLARELGADVLDRVPVKLRVSDGDGRVRTSFRPAGEPAVEITSGSPDPVVFQGLDDVPTPAVPRPWSQDGRIVGMHYSASEVDAVSEEPTVLGDVELSAVARDRVTADFRGPLPLTSDPVSTRAFTDELRASGTDLPVDAVNVQSIGSEHPSADYLISGGEQALELDRRMVEELVRAASHTWWFRPQPPAGPVRVTDRAGTVKLLGSVLTRLRRGGSTLDLTSVALDVHRHERPDLVWTAVLELAALSPTLVHDVRHVIDRRLDASTGRWQVVDLPSSARKLFAVTDKGIWRAGAVCRPARLGVGPVVPPQSPGRRPLGDEQSEATLARWMAESIVERVGDGLPAPVLTLTGSTELQDRLVARIQAELDVLNAATPIAAAELVALSTAGPAAATVSFPETPLAPRLSPAETAAAAGLSEHYALLHLHGVPDTLLGKDNPDATTVLLDLVAATRDGADVARIADAMEVLDRHGALAAVLSAPGGRTLLLEELTRVPDQADPEGYARDLATATRALATEDLPADVLRAAVRGTLDGWPDAPDSFGERVEQTRETLWTMHRLSVVGLGWLDRWRTAAAIRRYREQQRAASARNAAALASLTEAGSGTGSSDVQ